MNKRGNLAWPELDLRAIVSQLVKFVLLTGFCLVARASPGDLDAGFGNGGKVLSFFGGGDSHAKALAIQADGKIVVAGSRSNGSNNDFALVRYNADGTLDTSFGMGGRVMTPVYSSDDVATALVIQADGKIIAAGNYVYYSIANAFALVRYNSDGSRDASFGNNGVVFTHVGSDDRINAIALQSDGKIVVAGVSGYNALARYNTDGSLDKTFGSAGTGMVVATNGNGVNAMAIQTDGKIVGAGSSLNGSDFVVVRFNVDGTPDTGFGGAGVVQTAIGTGTDIAYALAIQPDGKIVAAGYTNCNTCSNYDFGLVRYNTNGTLDTSFGSAGKVVTSIGTNDIARAVMLQSDGKIVAGGYSDSNFALARYTSSGVLDSSFGAGGKVTTPAGGQAGFAVAIQADGRIVMAGDGYSGSTHFQVVRYNTDGTLDTGFNGSGRVLTNVGTKASSAQAVALQADGKIVAVGHSPGSSGTDDNFAFARYNANGTPDTGFGSQGTVNTNSSGSNWDDAYAVAIQPDGKIIAAGATTVTSSTWASYLVRYNTDGTLDSSFGSAGKVTTSIGGSSDGASALALQPDGKILAAGSSYNTTNKNYDVALVRYLPAGTLDTSFGSGGKVVTAIGTLNDGANGIAVQPDGKIVVAGYSASSTTKTNFALLRYNSDGTLDASFGAGGKVTTAIGAGLDGAYAVALQQDGKIIAAGDSHNGTNTDFALARYNPDGSLDASFGSGGKLTTPIEAGNDVATAIALQQDGKIVVAGTNDAYQGATRSAMAIVRYTDNGSIDASFGSAGKVSVVNDRDRLFNQKDLAYALAIQSDGRIVVAGVVGGQFGAVRLLGDPPTVTTTTTSTTTSTSTTTTTLAPTTTASSTTTSTTTTTTASTTTTTLATTTTTSSTTTSTTTTTTASTTTTTLATTTTTSSTTTSTTTTTTPPTTTTTLASGSVTASLVPGWNLIGNGNGASLDVAAAFGNTTNVTTVWKWVANTTKWAFFAPSLIGQALTDYATSKGYDVLSIINGGEGFWVNAKQAFNVQMPAGTKVVAADFQPAGSKALVQGWNLISMGETKTPVDFNLTLSATPPSSGTVPSNITTLWAWDSGLSNWYFYAPSLDANGGLSSYITNKGYLDFTTNNKTLGPGVGFWVNHP